MSHSVAVMYHGKIVESGTRDQLFGNPLHPYTHSLMKAIPVPDPELERENARSRAGKADDAEVVLDSGCRFRARCPLGAVSPRCATDEPELVPVGPGHRVACHFPQSAESVLHQVGVGANPGQP
jgi:oligopeptide/dipeptide ABC transporter ATP-binding protein